MSILDRLLRSIRRDGVRSRPAAIPAGLVDWHAIGDYSTLYRRLRQVHFPDPQSFIAGPFARFLDFIDAAPGRPGARIMEHARASLDWFREHERQAGHPVEWLDATADRLVRERFGSGSPDHDYMIEVFEGRATHNYRASDEDEVEG